MRQERNGGPAASTTVEANESQGVPCEPPARHVRTSSAAIIALSADGMLGVDGNHRITVFNPALEHFTGIRREDALGQLCRDVLRVYDNNDNPLCNSGCPLAAGECGTFDIEGTMATTEGHKLGVDLHFAVQCSRSGKLRRAVVNVRDASKLQQVNHIRSVLLALVSHELQTPISIIKAYASTLARSDANWSEELVREKLGAIEEESDRLSRLVSRLLYTTRLEANAVSLNPMLIDLVKESQRVAKRLAELDETHELVVSFPGDFPPVMGDPEKINEVLTNLIENAMKFSPEGGTITVEGTAAGDEVQVSIGDQGIGISEAEQSRIFERFYRVSESGMGTVPGTGLGLHICRILVQAHGGRIWVESRPGEGSRFTFSLPIAREE
ncbi:MAG: cell wall metabolism sensor histidine kinase WalK [Dehalococcoidia bacterium]|nr:cell wall metabolism sensor histidine kinase WalK [Dehalococcoidia bacterium]